MRVSFVFLTVVCLSAFGFIGTAFGWYSTSGLNTHGTIATQTLSYQVLQSLMAQTPGVNWNDVKSYSSEPPTDTFHRAVWVGYYISSEWEDLRTRSYLDTAGISPVGNNWNSLTNETTRLQYLTHLAADTAVPSAWHYPAYEIDPTDKPNTGVEKAMELGLGLFWYNVNWVGETNIISRERYGYTYTDNYTGTIFDIINSHHSNVISNAYWARSNCDTGSFFGPEADYGFDQADYDFSANRATEQAQMFMRAVVADYILAKELPVAYTPDYLGTPGTGGRYTNITFNQAGSHDPDAIFWNADGSYSDIYGIHPQGLTTFRWDFNGDAPSNGQWDYTRNSDSLTVSTSELLSKGAQPDQWNRYYVQCSDNEGKYSEIVSGYVWVAPEPASWTLLLLGAPAFFLLRRLRRA